MPEASGFRAEVRVTRMTASAPRVNFSLSALLGAWGDAVPRERYQDPNLCQNANGSWYIRPWVDKITAAGLVRRKKQIVLGPASMGRREAIIAKRRVMETINRASYVVQSQIRFSALLDEYIQRHVNRQAAPTQNKYNSLIKNHLRPAFGDLQLLEITPQKVQEWLDAKKAAGKSWSTCADLRNLMSGIFERAAAWKFWQDTNPIEHVTPGRRRLVREKKKLTDEQTQRLLAALPGEVRTMACVALFCTLRISEVLGLQEKHVDLAAGELVIEQRFHRGDLDTVKSQKSERRVPMGYLAENMRRLCLGDPERFVFQMETRPGKPGPKQRRYICRDDRGLLRYFLRPAAKAIKCDTPGFGWHSLRREAVTAFNASLGVTQAMRLAGHASADLSAEYTLRDREAQDKAVRERQMKILGEPKGRIV
jgi:integrase